jgi:hypothetical protein
MRKIIPLLIFTCTICACSSIDCPLQNTVYSVYKLRNYAGVVDTLKDTLTVSTQRADGTDSVLINKDVTITSFSLPVSYTNDKDILIFHVAGKTSSTTDTVTVVKTNSPHFESIDCSPSYFHTITNVSCSHHAIDSVVINNSNVNYDNTKETFHIYFKSRN